METQKSQANKNECFRKTMVTIMTVMTFDSTRCNVRNNMLKTKDINERKDSHVQYKGKQTSIINTLNAYTEIANSSLLHQSNLYNFYTYKSKFNYGNIQLN